MQPTMNIDKQKKKAGPKAGAKYQKKHSNNEWAMLCKKYVNGPKMTQKAFLESDASGPNFSGTSSEIVSFSKRLKAYKSGDLKVEAVDFVRKSEGKFTEVEEKIITYIKLRSASYHKDKLGLSFDFLKEKASKYAKEIGLDEGEFKASSGWLTRCLNRANLTGLKLHGEASEMPPEERKAIMDEWKSKEFHPLIEKFNVRPECIWNADQTGLFYQKLPNRIYVDKAQKKNYKGTKQMKDKSRITVMVCTAADGSKSPLSIVGKAKKPTCFTLCENDKPPMAYTNQKAAWFDTDVTMWWLLEVFWPHHIQKHGHSHCILLLDNCPAHAIDTSTLPEQLHILFLPPNMTSNHQPADMGMIASLKVGYKTMMVRKLLEKFDVEGGYEAAAKARMQMRKGCRGLDVGGKATILDAMNILKNLWIKDAKYAREDGIRRCWRKADILPLEMNTEINKELGQASVSADKKSLSTEDCEELCSLMKAIQLKTKDTEVDINSTAIALQGSFAGEHGLNDKEMMDMALEWIEIEDDQDILDDIVDEEIEILESEAKVPPEATLNNEDDEEPEVQMIDDMEEEEALTHLEAMEHVRKLTISCKKLGLSEAASVHLERFKKSLIQAQSSKKTTNTTLHDYFPVAKKAKKD